MGHPEPFDLRYLAIGNQDCWMKNYHGIYIYIYILMKLLHYSLFLFLLNACKYKSGNYLKFYKAIKSAYPDIKIISNCDGSSRPLDHPADLYDFHVSSSNITSALSFRGGFLL